MKARVWPTADISGKHLKSEVIEYPEVRGRKRPSTTVGLAFSGGGTVSATATVGALRGLKHLGLLDDVDYLSGISGGTWGLLPYVFLDAKAARAQGRNLGDIRSQQELDDRYIGTYKAPGDLIAADLETCLPGSVISLVTDTKFHFPLIDLRGDENFSHMLTDSFLAPLGLGDEKRFVCGSEEQLQDIMRRNPHLIRSDFYVAGKGKPFLIAGMALEREHRVSFFDKLAAAVLSKKNISEGYFPAETTPFYTGMKTVSTHRFRETLFPEVPVGGGFIETFGFDALFSSWEQPQELAVVRNTWVGPWPLRGRPFSLGDMMAASGAAPAAGLGSILDPIGLRPEFRIFSPAQAKPKWHSREQPFVDGGACDNTGVAALLARGVTNIVVFLNSVQPYETEFEKSLKPCESKLTTMLASLFGRVGVERSKGGSAWRTSVLGNPGTNHLLADPSGTQIKRIEDAFDRLAEQGRPLVFCDDYRTSSNERSLKRYGVAPNQPVRICWVYLTAAGLDEKKQLKSKSLARTTGKDLWLKKLRHVKPWFEGDQVKTNQLKSFPAFPVFGASSGHIQQLTLPQANALAHYSAHNVVESAAAIRRAFAEAGTAP